MEKSLNFNISPKFATKTEILGQRDSSTPPLGKFLRKTRAQKFLVTGPFKERK